MYKKIILYIIISAFGASCIKKEAPNSEADIIKIIVPKDILKAEPIIQNNSILVMVKENTDLSNQNPDFELTKGATINPPGNTKRDFSVPQEYIVTSEDNNWSKKYIITYINSELNTKYQFEDTVKRNTKYYIFAEKENNKVVMEWGSGNAGFAVTGIANSPLDFPTVQSPDGRIGKCAKLTTRSTGSFGASVGMPMAAGNLFIGRFDMANALSNPLKATKFGSSFTHKPTILQGYYKYKRGSIYKENGITINDKFDNFNIYAVFFETDKNTTHLDGTNQLTHPNIIATAQILNRVESDEWKKFEIPFRYKDGKIIDNEKLSEGKYSISIIFTSSKDGHIFNGAEGSTLMVDDVEIIYSDIK